MRYLHKVAIAFSIVLLFAPLAHSQTPARRTAQTQHRTLRPQPRYNAFHSHTFTGVATDVGIRVGTIMGWHQIAWSVTGTVTACQVQLDDSPDGINWTLAGIFPSETCTSSGHPTPATVAKTTTFIRLNVTSFTGTGSVLVDYYGFTSNPGGGGGGGGGVSSFNGRTGAVVPVGTPTSGDYTCLTSATCMIAGAATLASPSFTGTPSAATATTFTVPAPSGAGAVTPGNNQVATTAFVFANAGGGGTGNISGSLSSPFLPVATNTTGASTVANSHFEDTTVAGATTGLYNGLNFGVGAGDPSCNGATGCVAMTEGTIAGPGGTTSGHSYIRADSALHTLKFANLNGEFYLPQVTNTGSTGQAVLSNGDGTFTAADPSISTEYVFVWNNVNPATNPQTIQILNPLRSGYGNVSMYASGTFNNIPTSVCTLGLYGAGTATNIQGDANSQPFATIQFTIDPGFRHQSIPIIPDPTVSSSAGVGNGAPYIVAKMSCSNPPSGASLSLVFTPIIGNGPPFTCNRKIIINTNSSGATQLIGAQQFGKIYVCGWTVNTGSTTPVNVNLLQGSNNNSCATSTPFSETVALQALSNNAPVGVVNNAPANVVDATAYNQALCINLSAAPSTGQFVFGKLWYAQF